MMRRGRLTVLGVRRGFGHDNNASFLIQLERWEAAMKSKLVAGVAAGEHQAVDLPSVSEADIADETADAGIAGEGELIAELSIVA
jgi:hypothetical protein